MIIAESFAALALLFLALDRKYITDYRLIILCIPVIFFFSLFPSIGIPYIIDDVDHLHNLATAINTHRVIQWLFAPHNEHVIPFIKLIYYFCYRFFFLDPVIFHLAVIVVCLCLLLLIYKLILIMTKNPLAALGGSSIMAASNLTDDAMFIGTNAHIFFCALFFLFLFYAMYQWACRQNKLWCLAAFVTIILLPSTFALGLTSIVFVFLFDHCCLPQESRQNMKKIFPLMLTGWLLSLAPYAYGINAIIHTDHYKDVGAHSIFGVIHLKAAAVLLFSYVASILVPGLLNNAYLSFGLFFLCAYAVIVYTREVPWKKVLFFIVFGLFNNFIIFAFRAAWGAYRLDTPRYYVFPLVMMAFCYPLFLDAFIKHTPFIKKMAMPLAVSLLCFFIVVDGGIYRYENSNKLLYRAMIMQNLYVNFRKAFVEYFQGRQSTGPVKVKDVEIKLADVAWPLSKPGSVFSLSRYPIRRESFYAAFILPASINSKIIWADKTDPDFFRYLTSHQYYFLTSGNDK